MLKKILILGASILQIPAIKKAKDLGYYVGVIDHDKNARGIKFADQFFNVSTIDEEKVLEVAEQFKPDGIITLGTDMPMRSIALVTEKLKLPGISYDSAIKSTDKGEMIKAFEQNNVACPWHYVVGNLKELNLYKDNLAYPCILKPTDNSGSRGVMLVESPDRLEDAFNYSLDQSRKNKVIIEEYLQGPEVSVEIIVENSYFHVLAITDKITTGPPHFVEIGHAQPSQLSEKDLKAIEELALKSVKALGIQNGPVHAEIILTKNGPKMVEVGARMGGGFIASHLVPLSTGNNMIEATIKLACNDKINIFKSLQKGSAISYIPSPIGRLVEVNGIKEAMKLPGVKDIIINKRKGEIISELKDGTDRLGFVIAEGNTREEADNNCYTALKHLEVLVK